MVRFYSRCGVRCERDEECDDRDDRGCKVSRAVDVGAALREMRLVCAMRVCRRVLTSFTRKRSTLLSSCPRGADVTKHGKTLN